MTTLQKLIPFASIFFIHHLSFADDNPAPIGDAVEELPIFDAHMHCQEPAWKPLL